MSEKTVAEGRLIGTLLIGTLLIETLLIGTLLIETLLIGTLLRHAQRQPGAPGDSAVLGVRERNASSVERGCRFYSRGSIMPSSSASLFIPTCTAAPRAGLPEPSDGDRLNGE
ncbi:hypothetical protein NHX12_025368 [Muraenolepis orangiensis]|uniref:Uncharacterized protein n=1 Tax=Muraenolepis orangiensis TaxID=630683 RepID=A0A9Q0IRI1_9TELE|nr:hypothetical protein NHX12_025368 [Muraenolepis orangiensis]